MRRARVSGNRLLDALPEVELARLLVRAVEVDVAAGDVVLERGAPVRAVLFPTSGLFTTAVAVGGVEGGTGTAPGGAGGGGGAHAVIDVVGRDGVLSLADAVGDATSSQRVHCLVAAEVVAVPLPALRLALGEQGALGTWVGGLLQAGHAQLARKVVCTDRHPAAARCATWLLRAADGSGRTDLPLTQRQLAQVLRLRRVTVTTSLAGFSRTGAIAQSYGRITITDRSSLQGQACDCYQPSGLD